MFRNHQSFLCAILGLMLGVCAAQPLRAQLDPRLQNSKTDFLDLYQQSSSLKPKPEIATIFDSSFSMNTLMFHPLYQNNDLQDADDYRWMSFALTNASTSASYTYNTYTITAKDSVCTSATATYTVTVNSNGTATGVANTPAAACTTSTLTAPTITITAAATGDANAKTTLVFTPKAAGNNPSYTITSSTNSGSNQGTATNPYCMETSAGGTGLPTISYSASSGTSAGYPTGAVFTFNVYMAHTLAEGETNLNENITWSATSGAIGAGTMNTTVAPAVVDKFYQSTTTWTIPNFTQTLANPTQLKAITCSPVSGNAAFQPGAVLTLSDYYTTLPASPGTLTWTVSNSGGNTCAAGSITGSPTTATTALSNKSVTWTIPAYCSGGGVTTPAKVVVTLNPQVGSSYTAPGVTYLTANLSATTTDGSLATSSALWKPNGTPVQASDADAAITGSMANPSAPSLAYEKFGRTDVRNWIRAASHVRFTVTTPLIGGKTYVRTIDIPIPWKIMDATQAGNPLGSTTVPDTDVVSSIVAGNSVNTTYGSGLNIEMDQTYKVENAAGGVFAADVNGTALTAAATTSVTLYCAVYRPAYISWLFTGTYGNTVGYLNNGGTGATPGSLNYSTDSNLYTAGQNFVVFDALNNALNYDQKTYGSLSWGQQFGPVGTSWGAIRVPTVTAYGVQTGADISPAPDASSYRIPSMTRFQAVKSAAIQTWISQQAAVYWAFRELDPINESSLGTATTINNNSTTTLSASNPATTHVNGLDSGWTVLNNTSAQGINSTTGNSVTGMTRISYLFANSETPLTYAVARALAQYQDPNSVFDAVEGANVSQCSNSFLMVFTDGIDNNGQEGYNNPNTTTPYLSGTGATTALNALAGNDYIIANQSSINRSGAYWNLFTFAGMAAHLADPSLGVLGTDYLQQGSPGTTVTTGTPSQFLPFAISQRGNAANSNLTLYQQNHRVTIMTVGVSLGGLYNTAGGPKANLFQAAVVGDPSSPSPSNSTQLLSNFHTFTPPTGTWPSSGWAGVYLSTPTYPATWTPNDWVVNPRDPGDYPTVGMRAPGAVYFFDGSNPNQIIQDMNYAFKLAIGTASNNATSNPDLPFVGASLGQEVYLGSFQPPITGGVIWPGDLQMFATRTSSTGSVNFLDQNGNITTTLNSTTAQWTASSAVAARLWSARNLYTRLPATSTTEPGITTFSTGNSALLPYVATSQGNGNIVQAVVQFAAGGNTATVVAPTPPTTNRSNIMGDIIDSAPAAVQYDFSQVALGLTSRLSAVGGSAFRLILVGDNQGWVHGFGEVSKSIVDPNGDGQTLVTGNVDELWAFMPTDFLANLDYVTNNGNTHRYMADGSPTIYFLNLPSASGGPGTGVVESNERAVAIFGLGKGGRSYYALDIHNPYTPTLLWSLVPDEAAKGYFNPNRNLTSGANAMSNAKLSTLIANMGYSTATPALGRVTYNGVIHDCVFLSGGMSEPEVEANFLTGGNPTPLGRSVIALDVYSGQVLAAADLSAAGGFWQSNVGSIYAGVVPFEYVLNSGFAQRAYFTDYTGGLWSWGSKAVASTSPYVNFRVDSSEITTWSMRKVFQDDNTTASGLGGRYSTLPAPFLDTNFPGPALSGSATPTAVGVAMVSGDRNNPLDENYYTTPLPANLAPIHHNLTVVFDRQDSRALGLDTANGPDTGIQPGIGGANRLVALDEAPLLATPASPCTDPWFSVFTSGCSNYFFGTASSPKYGYYVPFPSISGAGFIPKGINPPILVANELLYSYFTPTASNPCTGGSGTTSSYAIANVMSPIVIDQRAGQFVPSGLKTSWTGVASNFIAVGTTSVLQGGTQTTTNASTGVTTTNPAILNTPTQPGSRYPKVHVWRDVQ